MDLEKVKIEVAQKDGFDNWEQMVECFCTTEPGRNVINRNIEKVLSICVVGIELPTKEEINIEGHKRHPVNLQDAGIAYSNRIQRNNFINGANWLRSKIKDNGN